MLISELNEFTGTLGASDYFATDNGNDTRKVSSQAIVNMILASVREIFYGTSSTSASTSTKVVSCSGFSLKTGTVIAVKFTYAQTSTASIYLNVNGTGAKQVYGIPRVTTSTSRLDGAWEANEVKLFVYDGSYWRIVDQNIITNDQLTSLQSLVGVYGLYAVLNALSTNAVIESGTTDGWTWKKYANGIYEAEAIVTDSSVSLSSPMFTVEGITKMYMSGGLPKTIPTLPHTLVSGDIYCSPLGNSTGYAFHASFNSNKYCLLRPSTATVTINDVKSRCYVVNGRWK